jgi:gluconolactonase
MIVVTQPGRRPAADADVLDRDVRLLHVADVDAHEGPAYAADEHALYVTSVPRPGPEGPVVAIRRIQLGRDHSGIGVRTLVDDANAANGMTLSRDGTLLVCEQGGWRRRAAIARVDRRTGARETVVDAFAGLPLNSPNDVIEARDGSIWFTDPSYGHLQGFRPPPAVADAVLRYDPASARLEVLAADFDKPNGLALSPDERTLYVADSGADRGTPGRFEPARPHHVRALDLVDRRVAGGRVLAVTPAGAPDGVKVDRDGRVYATFAGGVQVLAPTGAQLGEIALPGAVNLCFGGPERNVLYITTDTAVWAAVLHARGA